MKFSILCQYSRPRMSSLLAKVLLLLAASWTFHANASCRFLSGYGLNNASINLPAVLTLKRDAAVGSIVYDSGWVNGGNTQVNCGGGSATFGYASMMTAVPGMANVYATGIPGVGIKAGYSNSYGAQPSNIDSIGNGAILLTWPRSSVGTTAVIYTPAGLYRIQFIVTGQLKSGSWTMSVPNPAAQTVYEGLLTNQASFTNTTVIVNAVTCAVSTPSVNVPLSYVRKAQFKAVGTTLLPTPFKLSMTCPKNVAVSYQLNGTSSTDVASSGILANSAGQDMAKGVGVQVLKSDGVTPLPFGVETPLGTSTADNQAMVISLVARYYQVQANVTGGKVSTLANVTLYYK